jgi:hypothetical protein
MRTTITIQDDLYRRVKSEAAATGRSVGELIEDALRDALAPRPAAASARVTLPTVRGGGPMPGVNLDSNAALLDLMDEGVPFDARR